MKKQLEFLCRTVVCLVVFGLLVSMCVRAAAPRERETKWRKPERFERRRRDREEAEEEERERERDEGWTDREEEREEEWEHDDEDEWERDEEEDEWEREEDEGEWEDDEDWDEEEEWEKRRDWEREERARLGPEELLDRGLRYLPERERDQARELIEEIFPGELEEFEFAAGESPERAERILDELIEESRRLIELREDAPEEFRAAVRRHQLERESWELAEELHGARGGRKEELTVRLSEVLAELFEFRQHEMEAEIGELNNEVRRIQGLFEKRQAHREAIIERRIRQLTGEMDYLEW